MSALPSWAADNAEARAILAALQNERPDCWYLPRYADDATLYPRYKGFTARALRQLWEAERDAAMEANDRPRWIELGQQQPDDLIDRLLTETGEQLVETQSDPFLPTEWAA